MFLIVRLRETTVRPSRNIEGFVPLALLHVGSRSVDTVQSGSGIEGQGVRADANNGSVLLMVKQMVDVPVADVCLPEERPAAELVGQWARVIGKWMEVDAVDAYQNYLCVISNADTTKDCEVFT
jgi:hypothetical protein